MSRDSWIYTFLLGFFSAVVVLLYLLKDNEAPTAFVDDGVIVESTPLQVRHDFRVGDLVKAYGSTRFCPDEPQPEGSQQVPCAFPSFNLVDGDIVEIIGEPVLYKATVLGNGWWWPVRGVQSGIYTEGESGWIPDETSMFELDRPLPARPTPVVGSGDTALTAYNFLLHESPGGPTIPLPDGHSDWIEGGKEATLLEEPVQIDPPHGRYWCHVSGWGTKGWVSCEFQLLPE